MEGTDGTGRPAFPMPPALAPIATRLLDSAGSFAQVAMRAYREEDWAIFYVSLATAFELLVKGALAHANPAYIADPRSFDALLHLTGRGERASKPEFVAAAKTIQISEAVDRAARVVDGYPGRTPLIGVLLDRRNGVIHAGTTVTSEEAKILGEVGRHAAPLLTHVGRTPAHLWGHDADLVAELAAERVTEIQAATRRRIDAARAAFAELADRLGEPLLSAFVSSRERTDHSPDFDAFPVECPSCGRLGMLEGEPEAVWEADYDNDGDDWFVSGVSVDRIRFTATSFTCRVCGLALDGDEVEAAGMNRREITDDDTDLSDATDYFRAAERDDDDYDYR